MYNSEKQELINRLHRHGYASSPQILEAMAMVPREEFLPPSQKRFAYEDTPLCIGEGQTISAPHMVSLMLELLDLRPGSKILEIGTGSGYHAALMGYLVRPGGKIFTIERIKDLGERACDTLGRFGFGDVVEVIIADGSKGLPDHAPYDRIIVTAAAPDVPAPLKDQLVNGGRLLLPVGNRSIQDLVLIIRQGNDFTQQNMGEVVFVPLVGQYGYSD